MRGAPGRTVTRLSEKRPRGLGGSASHAKNAGAFAASSMSNAPFSSFAGNPYFVDLDELAAKGWLKESDLKALDWGRDPRYVDYGKIWENREKTLKKAYGNFLESASKEDRETYEEELKKLNPQVEKNIFRSVENVNLSTIIAYKERGVTHHFLDNYDNK